MGLLGMDRDSRMDSVLKRGNRTAPCSWLRDTLMAFRIRPSARQPSKPDSAAALRLRQLLRARNSPAAADAFVKLYANTTRHYCPYVEAGCSSRRSQ